MILIKGTYLNLWESIKNSGLNKMSRNHIHLAAGYKNEVISGMRKSCNLFIEIDLEKAFNDNIKFFVS